MLPALEGRVEQFCVVDRAGFAAVTDLVAAHKTWAERNNERALSSRGMSMKLLDRGGFERVSIRVGREVQRGFYGLKMRSAEPS